MFCPKADKLSKHPNSGYTYFNGNNSTQAKSKGLTHTLITEALTSGKCWDDIKDIHSTLPITKSLLTKNQLQQRKISAPNIPHSPIMMSPLNKKLPIMKQNLHIFFSVIGRVKCTLFQALQHRHLQICKSLYGYSTKGEGISCHIYSLL